ncbi:MAG TPA: ABC transporter ATP-binding protein [Chloroflexota bacterium]|jgi:ABC-2 type transport system ATP-binding protein|nr:ABC transporter ATP-binding protein [Chloroflexota bacterium]
MTAPHTTPSAQPRSSPPGLGGGAAASALTRGDAPHSAGEPLAIETHGLRKEYGRKVAVANVSLRVPAGEVFGFLGPNGAGKSTTVKMLVGLVRPTAGHGTIFGRPLGDPVGRRRLGFLPEQFRFHEWLRAEEFLDFHASLYGIPRRERSRRIADALDIVGLEARARDTLRTFSKGMLQRIGIAQAVIADPDLVILDEPTSALDPLGRRDVRDLIRRLRERGIAVLLNSHLLSEVEMVCDRVAIIDRGLVVHQGTLAELVGGAVEGELRLGPPTPSLLAALQARWPVVASAADEAGGQWTLRLALTDESELAEAAELVVRAGTRLYALVPHRKTLEDLFVQAVETREAR